MAEQEWYEPVNIGYYYLNFLPEERIQTKDLEYYFAIDQDDIINLDLKKDLQVAVDEWKKHDDGNISPEFQNDPYFVLNSDYKIDYKIDGFSADRVNISFFFEYGASRWHHYLVRIKNLVLPRTTRIDSLFALDELEAMYTIQIRGIGYNSTFEEMEKNLGKEYFEYIGQSLQLRNIYYPGLDVEVCVQDEMVKYIKEGRPGWMDSNNVIKPKSENKNE